MCWKYVLDATHIHNSIHKRNTMLVLRYTSLYNVIIMCSKNSSPFSVMRNHKNFNTTHYNLHCWLTMFTPSLNDAVNVASICVREKQENVHAKKWVSSTEILFVMMTWHNMCTRIRPVHLYMEPCAGKGTTPTIIVIKLLNLNLVKNIPTLLRTAPWTMTLWHAHCYGTS